MYYLKNAEKKWCPCDVTGQQKNFIYAPMDKPKIPIYGQVNVRLSESPIRISKVASGDYARPRRVLRQATSPPARTAEFMTSSPPARTAEFMTMSSQLVAPDANTSIPSAVERYSGFVPYTARPRERFVDPTRERFVDPSGDSLIIDYGNAMIPPSVTNVPAEQYDAAIAAFYETLGMPAPSTEYNFDAVRSGPIPIEATAYASLPAEYAENFTPLKVNRYGTVSKWK